MSNGTVTTPTGLVVPRSATEEQITNDDWKRVRRALEILMRMKLHLTLTCDGCGKALKLDRVAHALNPAAESLALRCACKDRVVRRG